MNRKTGLKTPINELSFYYNKLAETIANDILDNLELGIKIDETQYEWPYELLIDKEDEDTKYFNFTFGIDRIPSKHFIKNDVVATSGLDECCMPHIKMQFMLQENKWIKKHDYTYSQIIGVVAHELHHLSQDFDLVDFTAGNITEYFLNPIEIEAFHIGFRAEADNSNKSIKECIESYLNNFLDDERITTEDYKKIIVKWLKPEIKLLKGVNGNES